VTSDSFVIVDRYLQVTEPHSASALPTHRSRQARRETSETSTCGQTRQTNPVLAAPNQEVASLERSLITALGQSKAPMRIAGCNSKGLAEIARRNDCFVMPQLVRSLYVTPLRTLAVHFPQDGGTRTVSNFTIRLAATTDCDANQRSKACSASYAMSGSWLSHKI
jgi:hypothetical protein